MINYHTAPTLYPIHDQWDHLLPDRIAPTDQSPEEQCFAGLMKALDGQLQPDALLACWYPTFGDAEVLYADVSPLADPRLKMLLERFAADCVSTADERDQPFEQRRNAPSGQLTALAFPSPEGMMMVAMLSRSPEEAAPVPGAKPGDFIPVLRPFFNLWMESRAQRARVAGLNCAVENCDIAMLLVDRHCRVLFANNAAEKLGASADGITLGRGRLAASELTDTLRLQAAVEHICGGGGGAKSVLPIIALRRSGGRHLMVTAVAVPDAKSAAGGDCAILYAFDPEEDLSKLIEPACKFYRLSAGETRLTCRLANGGTLAQAAKALGLKEQTARSYLKQIFLKTQTNRQAELVWLMLKSAVRVTNTAQMCVF